MFIPHLIYIILSSTQSLNDANKGRQNERKAVLMKSSIKFTIEEKYFVIGEMSNETYEKFLTKFTNEKEDILDSFRSCSVSSSNLESFLENVVTFSAKVTTGWTSSAVKLKENLQKLVFPSGISYCIKYEAFRTENVNFVFAVNAELNRLSEYGINKQGGMTSLFSFVGMTGLASLNQKVGELNQIKPLVHFVLRGCLFLRFCKQAFNAPKQKPLASPKALSVLSG